MNSPIATPVRRDDSFGYVCDTQIRDADGDVLLICNKTQADELIRRINGWDGLERDAARYRWLRDNPEHESVPYYEDGNWCIPYLVYGAPAGGGVGLTKFSSLDAAVDHCLASAAQPSPSVSGGV